MNKNDQMDISRLKLKHPCRNQLEMHVGYLDEALPEEHLARSVWEFVEAMDTSPCCIHVATFLGYAGRSATSPKVLLALWLYSILDGNCSARKLEELCQYHIAYKWIAGGVSVNRTMLADFRSKHPAKFRDLLTNCLAVMLKAGLIKDEDFAQDGSRIKANAGFNSFRKEASLEKIKEEIQSYIKTLDAQGSNNTYEKRQQEQKQAVVLDRLKRVQEAINTIESERIVKKENGKKNCHRATEQELMDVRASITDPAVRKMKMGDGGYRLAYNLQFATGLDSRVIFGVDVVTTLDPGTAPKLMAQVYSRLSKLNMPPPKNWIGDAAYSGKDDLNIISEVFPNCRYYAPPQVGKGIDPKKHKSTDSEAIKKWRDLIDNEEVKEIYKKRCSTAEFSNAQIKNHGLREFLVRGLSKVNGMACLHAIAHNIGRYLNLKKLVQV